MLQMAVYIPLDKNTKDIIVYDRYFMQKLCVWVFHSELIEYETIQS